MATHQSGLSTSDAMGSVAKEVIKSLKSQLTDATERERVLVECLKYIEKELRYIPDNIPLHFLILANKISAALAQVKGEK